jgi:hypothetical protein
LPLSVVLNLVRPEGSSGLLAIDWLTSGLRTNLVLLQTSHAKPAYLIAGLHLTATLYVSLFGALHLVTWNDVRKPASQLNRLAPNKARLSDGRLGLYNFLLTPSEQNHVDEADTGESSLRCSLLRSINGLQPDQNTGRPSGLS